MRPCSLQRKLEQLTCNKKKLHRCVIRIQKSFLEVDHILRDNCFKKGEPRKRK